MSLIRAACSACAVSSTLQRATATTVRRLATQAKKEAPAAEADWFTSEVSETLTQSSGQSQEVFKRPDFPCSHLSDKSGVVFWHPESQNLARANQGVVVGKVADVEAEVKSLSADIRKFMGELRNADPETFTVSVLSRRFNVSTDTVSRVAPLTPENAEKLRAQQESAAKMPKWKREKEIKKRSVSERVQLVDEMLAKKGLKA
eukprot:comp10677_c0_seq1/m.5349 comp10677_c0_seq1/g.5349  ORF comp10677_c0_seq1/g.5349 comp10677_c0_seq1/m.5349 type:complete len:203 (-) comp10677_c0_seq1:332-940(-)